MRSFMIWTSHQNCSSGQIKKNEINGPVACIRKGRGAYRVFVGNLWERDNLEDLGIDGRKNHKTDLQEIGWEAWTRLLRLKSGTGGRVFSMWRTFGFHKMHEISSLAVALLAFQHEVSYTQWQITVAVLSKNRFTVLLPSSYNSGMNWS
jgi:hypothetical protein